MSKHLFLATCFDSSPISTYLTLKKLYSLQRSKTFVISNEKHSRKWQLKKTRKNDEVRSFLIFRNIVYIYCQLISTDITIRAEGLGFNSRTSQIGQSVATAATFLRSCVTQTISRGERLRHSLHPSA